MAPDTHLFDKKTGIALDESLQSLLFYRKCTDLEGVFGVIFSKTLN